MLKDWHFFTENDKSDMVALANKYLEPYRLWMDGDYILTGTHPDKKNFDGKR